jgi:hypothetical protein
MPERNKRFSSNGQVFISQVTNTDVLLKNLSASGLCIESPDLIEIIPKTRYSVDIVPEKDANIDKFSLEIESRWIKTKMKSSESGFVIVIPPGISGKALLEQYLDYLSVQSDTEQKNSDSGSEASPNEEELPPEELLS